MIAKGGAPLLQENAMDALRTRLLPRAALLTPNLPEAEHLLGKIIRTEDEMVGATEALQAMGAKAVLLKGGHSDAQEIVDVLREESGEISTYRTQRIATQNTHGTGCTLASAVATGVAQGLSLPDATARAHAYVQEAIRTAPAIGHGHGPLNHGWPLTTKL
jgi:hydroxymethylpyrimidine/phosphomethylpyrimidine kinase